MAKRKRSDIEEINREMNERMSRASMLEGQEKDLLDRGEQLSKEIDFDEKESDGLGLGFQDFDEKVKELEDVGEAFPGEAGDRPRQKAQERPLDSIQKKKSKPKAETKAAARKPGPHQSHNHKTPAASAAGSLGEAEQLRKRLEEQKSLIRNLEGEKLSLAQIIEQISGHESGAPGQKPQQAPQGNDDTGKLRSMFEQRMKKLEEMMSTAGKKEGESMAGDRQQREGTG
jgi:hypothetical protein